MGYNFIIHKNPLQNTIAINTMGTRTLGVHPTTPGPCPLSKDDSPSWLFQGNTLPESNSLHLEMDG